MSSARRHTATEEALDRFSLREKPSRAPPGGSRGGADIVTSLLEKSCKRRECQAQN